MITKHRLIRRVLTVVAVCTLIQCLVARPLNPESGEDGRHILTNSELLARYGFGSDDPALLAAVVSNVPGARDMAYRVAYDRGTNVLVAHALDDVQATEQTLVLNFTAAKYLDRLGHENGTHELRRIAAIPEEQWDQTMPASLIFRSIEILTKAGDESYVHQLTACFRRVPRMDAIPAAQVLGAFTNPADPEVEEAWIAAVEHMNAILRSDDPREQSGAWLYATWLTDSVRKQSFVTQRIKDAFDAVTLPPERDDEHGRIAHSLDRARAHWATCELVESEPPPAEQPADPPPTEPE